MYYVRFLRDTNYTVTTSRLIDGRFVVETTKHTTKANCMIKAYDVQDDIVYWEDLDNGTIRSKIDRNDIVVHEIVQDPNKIIKKRGCCNETS